MRAIVSHRAPHRRDARALRQPSRDSKGKSHGINPDILRPSDHATEHPDLGRTAWYAVELSKRKAPRGAWQHTALPAFAEILSDRVAFAWHAMDAFYEEEERIVGHAEDAYHSIDIRETSRYMTVRDGEQG